MEYCCDDADRGNWITGRKTLYSVGVRWVNEYGALVEWYWQGKLNYSGKTPSQYFTQISHGLSVHLPRAFALRCRRPTALITARPIYNLSLSWIMFQDPIHTAR
jgi:hypothetical protein